MDDQITYEGEAQNESLLYGRFARSAQVPGMIHWILATGIVSNEQAACRVLLGILVAAVVLSIVIFVSFTGASTPPPPASLPTMI